MITEDRDSENGAGSNIIIEETENLFKQYHNRIWLKVNNGS